MEIICNMAGESFFKILMDLQAGFQRFSQENDSGVMITKGINCFLVFVQIPCYISTTIKPFTTSCEFIPDFVPNMWLPQS
jgi:hypothetical protein